MRTTVHIRCTHDRFLHTFILYYASLNIKTENTLGNSNIIGEIEIAAYFKSTTLHASRICRTKDRWMGKKHAIYMMERIYTHLYAHVFLQAKLPVGNIHLSVNKVGIYISINKWTWQKIERFCICSVSKIRIPTSQADCLSVTYTYKGNPTMRARYVERL